MLVKHFMHFKHSGCSCYQEWNFWSTFKKAFSFPSAFRQISTFSVCWRYRWAFFVNTEKVPVALCEKVSLRYWNCTLVLLPVLTKFELCSNWGTLLFVPVVACRSAPQLLTWVSYSSFHLCCIRAISLPLYILVSQICTCPSHCHCRCCIAWL